MGMVAATVGAGAMAAGASIYSGTASANAATSAAQLQAQSAAAAGNNVMAQFYTMQGNLSPYMSAGTNALTALQAGTGTGAGGSGTGALNAQFQPTMTQLAQTPGYQFTLNQGLQATQNGYAAQGLGGSGAAQKGAANYAEGLASTTYQQQFSNYLQQNQQDYNMLSGLVSQGETAAAGVGNAGLSAAGTSGSLSTSGAAASAAGIVGSTNALNSGISGAASSAGNYGLLAALSSRGMFGSGSENAGQLVYSSADAVGPFFGGS
jgi:hypothetical protein